MPAGPLQLLAHPVEGGAAVTVDGGLAVGGPAGAARAGVQGLVDEQVALHAHHLVVGVLQVTTIKGKLQKKNVAKLRVFSKGA